MVCWCWHWPLYSVSALLRANNLQWSAQGDLLAVWILKSVFRYCRPALSRIRMLSAIVLFSPARDKTCNNKYWCSVSLFKILTTRVRTAIMNGVSHRLVWVDEWCLQEWRAPAPHLSECYQDQPTISLVKPHKPEQKRNCFGFKLILFLNAKKYWYTTTTINPDQSFSFTNVYNTSIP